MDDVNATRDHHSYIVCMHKYEMSRRRTIFVGILGLTAAGATAQSSEIYKSIDANGNVVYSDHLDASMSQSTAVQLDAALLPARELHFCWTNCFTLVLDNGVYRRTDGTDESWTVETFSANAIVLHRHDAAADWNGYSQDVVYAGQVSNDRLIGVTVNGTAVRGIDASWGSALNNLPGSNAERNAGNTATPDASSSGSVSSSATPPPLPEEQQPALPEDGYLWTPGYWYWRNQAYVWIPGAWVRPPRMGVVWTPGYWGRAGTVFVFHPGHWGATVGFYGGVNYGNGYSGNGYSGGHWIGNSFAYDSAVNHLNPGVAHHAYARSEYVRSGDAKSVPAPQVANKPATTTRVERITERAPKPIEVARPAAVVHKPPAGAAPQFHHVAATPATAPVK